MSCALVTIGSWTELGKLFLAGSFSEHSDDYDANDEFS